MKKQEPGVQAALRCIRYIGELKLWGGRHFERQEHIPVHIISEAFKGTVSRDLGIFKGYT